ncbi:histidine phosphatase family protein [Sphingomonas sp. 28-62-11]|uniref:SixA phosphatase family protein n=1 Tax=Sphingomonas sp. 28-62-11 TaxID=1970432 RepID=UPI000BDC248A|nr:MAG: histidine phosphatase family protein [Sphingomonas sp. 28-62-11]
MKTLTLLRHAKSGWDDPVARDFDRALNARGKRGAAQIGQYLADHGLVYDYILASPAVRVTQTLDCLASNYTLAVSPEWERRIYLASAATLLELVAALPDSANNVLLVGHNPGLEDLVLMLVPVGADAQDAQPSLRDAVEIKFPTASLAELQVDCATWAEFPALPATLSRFVRPRDLDPSLGPDESD